MLTQPSEPELSSREPPLSWQNQNRMFVALLAMTGGWLFSLVVIFVLLLNNRSLALKEKIYVQQPDGTTEAAQEFDRYHREPRVIRETLTDWLRLTFEWDNRLPGTKETDPGFSVGGSQKVPSKTYAASYLLAPGFRQEFLKQLAEIIPDGVFQGTVTSNLVIEFISEPRTINTDPGKYEIDAIATRADVGVKGEQQVYLRKTFTLKAIEPQKLTLKQEEPSAFRKQLAILLRNGLMITDIVEFNPTQ